MKHSLAGACFLLYNENTIWQDEKVILPIYRRYKSNTNIGPKQAGVASRCAK